jgi:hypothetical protein
MDEKARTIQVMKVQPREQEEAKKREIELQAKLEQPFLDAATVTLLPRL